MVKSSGSPRLPAVALTLGLVAAACSSSNQPVVATEEGAAPGTDDVATSSEAPLATIDLSQLPRGELVDFGVAPTVPEGDYSPEAAAAVDTLIGSGTLASIFSDEQNAAIETLGDSGDPRVVWIFMDILRFSQDSTRAQRLVDASNNLTGLDVSVFNAWNETTNSLIAWDIPAPPNYVDAKRAVFSTVLPTWGPLFDNSERMDWRFVSWGGVLIDDRPFDTTDNPCNCIPAADNPTTQPAADAAWLDDDDIVFGVVINGEARAYPRQIMEVREMVNDTLGGRDFAMPYCTLCGAAQVWFTDDLPDGIERPVLRTSGLLTRSNKVMYELNTFSIFDTFLGNAQSGPLAEQGIELNQHTVVTSSWADWVEAHPNTDVLTEDLALGRDFDFRNGRDADGPIFPVGDVDPRLAVQEDVLGVTTADGTPLAFHVNTALAAIERGERVESDGIRILADGGGVRAEDLDGNEVVGHQAFWFAWSQFHPSTELWPS